MKSIKLALAAVLSIFVLATSAQPVLIDTLTVEELVNDFLLGDGVDATNITYNGVDADLVTVQVKLFQGNSSILDFDEGVIMASGDAGALLGGGTGGVEIQVQNDPDLVEISGQNINDASIIEFDFVVASDSLKFNYSFGSREYPGFTCTGFNDAFGFFLSGPGINGPFTGNAENIALIPNSDIAVAINTVNGGSPTGSGTVENCETANPNWIEDSQYFVDNSNPAPNDFDVPGLTQTFTAEAAVECGEEYHIKLAIGDALDTALDSYVFLEAGSFAAFGQIFASFNPVFNDGGSVNQEGFDSIPVAGCTSPLIELVRPQGSTFASIEFDLGGEAQLSPDGTPGSGDYWVPNGFPTGFPDGVDTVFFEIETINPNITDTLDIQLFIIYVTCAGVEDTTVVEIPIAPPPDIDIFTEDLTLICPADTLPLQLEPTAAGGLLPHIYEWFIPGEPPYLEEQDLLPPVPDDQETFFVRVTDQCEFNYDSSQVVVTNAFPPTFESEINPFTQPDCPNQTVELTSVDPSGTGSPPYVYFWESINSTDVAGNQSNVFVTDINPVALAFTDTLDIALTVADSCGRIVRDTVQINYPAHDTLSAFFTPLEDNCPDAPVLLESITEGGFGDYTYEWAIAEGESTFTDGFGPNTANTFIDDGPGFNTFTLTVRDECGRRGEDMVLDGSTDEEGNLIRTGSDTHSQDISYIDLDPPTVITPNGDGQNEVLVVPGINAFENATVWVYDRWGRLVYENNSYDAGTPEATPSQGFSAEGYEDGTYYYIVNIDSGECIIQKELQVLRGSD